MDTEALSAIITEHPAACVINCWIQPRASKSSIVGIHAEALKISLAAPPVDGQANAELCKFLAKKLGLPKSGVTIAAGESSRRKTVKVSGISKTALISCLNR